MATITHRQLRDQTTAILDRVEAGESLEITRDGRPVAELRPISGRRTFVSAELLRAALSGLERVDYQEMRREADELFGDDGDRIG